MEITLGHKYRWHATTKISLACNYQKYRWHATTKDVPVDVPLHIHCKYARVVESH